MQKDELQQTQQTMESSDNYADITLDFSKFSTKSTGLPTDVPSTMDVERDQRPNDEESNVEHHIIPQGGLGTNPSEKGLSVPANTNAGNAVQYSAVPYTYDQQTAQGNIPVQNSQPPRPQQVPANHQQDLRSQSQSNQGSNPRSRGKTYTINKKSNPAQANWLPRADAPNSQPPRIPPRTSQEQRGGASRREFANPANGEPQMGNDGQNMPQPVPLHNNPNHPPQAPRHGGNNVGNNPRQPNPGQPNNPSNLMDVIGHLSKSLSLQVGDKNALTALRNAGLNPVQTTYNPAPNPHGANAAVRRFLTHKAVFKALGLKKFATKSEIKIVDLYGSDREESLLFKLSNMNTVPKIIYEVYRPAIVSQDLPRDNVDSLATFDFTDVDLLIMTNVYKLEDSQFDEEFVSQIAQHTDILWIGHRFIGQYGTSFGESAWKRHSNEIEWFSDQETESYPLHPSLDWLTQGGVSGYIGWDVLDKIHDMVAIYVTRTPYPLRSGVRSKPRGFVEEQDHLLPSTDSFWFKLASKLFDWFGIRWPIALVRKFWPSQKVNIIPELKTKITEYLMGPGKTTYTLKVAYQKANEWKRANPQIILLERFFPDDVASMINDTVSVAFMEAAATQEKVLSTMRKHYGTAFSAVNTNLTQIAAHEDTPFSWWKVVASIGTILIGVIYYTIKISSFIQTKMFILNQARRNQSLIKALITTFRPASVVSLAFAPQLLLEILTVVFEEWLKKAFPKVGLTMVVGEFVIRAMRGQVALNLLPLHYICYRLPKYVDVVVHLAHNMIIFSYTGLPSPQNGGGFIALPRHS